ncbi:MAG: type I-U CRISPR-associated protein Csb2 [Solirubrobacteraceae bacterium]
MVGVAFTFPLGRYHATAWGTNVNEAAVDWPPSPWRVLRAMLAAGRDADDLLIDGALAALVASGDPVYELPPATPGHTRHYVPLTKLEKDGPPKTSLIIDAFIALDPAQELRVFWDVELGENERAALAAATRRMGYLGRSESLCEARLLPAEVRPAALGAWPEAMVADGLPAAGATTALMGVDPEAAGAVAILETDVGVLRKARRLIPEGTRQVRYSTVARPRLRVCAEDEKSARPTVVVLRIAGNALPDVARAVVVGSGMRRALQRRFDHDRSGRTSRVFSGHTADGPSARQHQHAHYLALPDATGGRVDRLAVWAPDGLGPDEMRALASTPFLSLREVPEPLQLALVSAGSAERALPAFARLSTTWETVTPMVLPRHMKPHRARDLPEAQVLAELAHRGFPDPVAIEEIDGAWGRSTRDRPGQTRHRTKSALGFRLRFAEPVAGPIVLGANCHFGLGLMRPVP